MGSQILDRGLCAAFVVEKVTRRVGTGTLRLSKVVAQQIAAELSFACRQIDRRDWWHILLKSAGRASSDTVTSKCRQVRNLGRLARSTGQRYIRDGVRNSARGDAGRAKQFVAGLPSRIRTYADEFRRLTRQQQADQVVDMMLTWIIFWASAGGSDLEGGLPDIDLAFGIGNHRNVVSHTVLLGLGSEIALRLGIEVFGEIYSRLPSHHMRAWDSSYRFLQTHRRASINAMWAGIGAHFLKDANLFAEATKPYTGMPISMPMDVHQALFAANGAACEAAAFVRD